MDENEFFRQAASRICGNLKIEEAMFSTLQYLRQVMPVDRMSLIYYDEGLNSARIIAMATQAEGKEVDLPAPISTSSRQQAAQKYPAKYGKI